ncbi:MAG TPA: MerR family transcriptional regulator [Candidatus Lumbricidophila sp.]|nr:MerR family transcriptional regulator [Candidatus Lumbricidophila sp.]
MDWSINEVARESGVTSRTLRHYADIGLLTPSRIGSNGYRYYDDRALTRLQRILLLRDLGLGLPQIAEVLAGASDEPTALGTHLALLRAEQARIERQIASVERTIAATQNGDTIMPKDRFDGFDHTQYKDEVEQRWGNDAYASSDAWWRGMSADERAAWKAESQQLGADWIAAASDGIDPTGDRAQALAKRHVDWLRGIPGTPAAPKHDIAPPAEQIAAYVTGLAEMYVVDERFAASYGGVAGASFVRDALTHYAKRSL